MKQAIFAGSNPRWIVPELIRNSTFYFIDEKTIYHIFACLPVVFAKWKLKMDLNQDH